MTSLEQANKSKARRAKPPGKKSSKANYPKSIYLRDINDLTLHGGIDVHSNLVILPVFSGLGTKGIKPKDFLLQTKELWANGQLGDVLNGTGWKPRSPTLYSMNYPALMAALPLPGLSVIDHILSQGDTDTASLEQAHSQIRRCMNYPRWRVFRNIGEDIHDSRETIDGLLELDGTCPGILTENFRLVLEAVQDLHSYIDNAEQEKKFVILSYKELCRAIDPSGRGGHYNSPVKNWSMFFKGLQHANATLSSSLAETKNQFKTGKFEPYLSQYDSENQSKWVVLPDISSENLLNFARTVESAQKQATISLESKSVDRDFDNHTSWRHGRERAAYIAQSRSNCLRRAMTLAWRIAVRRAIEKSFYNSKWLLPELSRAWSLRFSAESSFATLADQLPSRPIAEGGALVIRTDLASIDAPSKADNKEAQVPMNQGSFVRIEPATIRPQVAATRAMSQRKKFPRIHDRYLSLTSAMRESQSSVPSLYVDQQEQIFWPHGRIWQAVDMVKTLASQPKLLLNPEVLAAGFSRMPSEKWEQLGFKEGKLPDDPSDGPSWSQVYDWFLGVSPWPITPLESKRIGLYDCPYTSDWPLTIVDGGLAVADVRVAVQFVAAGEREIGDVRGIAQLLAAFSKAASKEVLESPLDELLSEIEVGLRFQPKPFFEVDGRVVEEEEWFNAVKTKAGYYRLACGLAVDSAVYLAKTDQFILRQRVYAKYKYLRLGELWPAQQEALGESISNLSPAEYIRQLSMKIAPIIHQLDTAAIEPVENQLISGPVKDLAYTFRPYQMEGIAWAFIRFHLGFGVCLADEMGLGKTLQAIAILKSVPSTQPSLVVMPKTLLHNWRRELSLYGKGLKVAIHGDENADDNYDVLLTTYPRLRLDRESLVNKKWNIVVLDEAQTIKNTDTQVAQAANQLDARHRLALTGTPIENRASELWSIINWLNPGYLGKQVDFCAYTSLARSSEQKSDLLQPLRECLDPIVLRRLKSDPKIELGLPDKVFLNLSCDLTDEQTILYESVIETVLAEVSMGTKLFARRAIFLKAILHLKQICLHPDLFYGEQDEYDVAGNIDASTRKATKNIRKMVIDRLKRGKKISTHDGWLARSAKLKTVRNLIADLKLQSRGILIFTQYLGAAELLRRAIAGREHREIPFIHGGLSSSSRLDLVDEFNENCQQGDGTDGCPVMILSLKAGGTGLNLIGADRVIHFDRWWNPAVEDQATDRAHRIGQDRSVFIHTVTCQGTIEESIARIFNEKRSLSDDLLGAATSLDVSGPLQNRDGFLELVDPQRTFSNRLIVD